MYCLDKKVREKKFQIANCRHYWQFSGFCGVIEKQLINIYDNIVEIAGLNVVSIRNNVFDEITKFTTAVWIIFLLPNLFLPFFSTDRISCLEMFCKISLSSLENDGVGVFIFNKLIPFNRMQTQRDTQDGIWCEVKQITTKWIKIGQWLSKILKSKILLGNRKYNESLSSFLSLHNHCAANIQVQLSNSALKKTCSELISCYRSLHEKCPYLEFFWSVFFRIQTEYSSEKLRIRTLFTQWISFIPSEYITKPNVFWNY